ncbi:MAG: DUF2075 domain-containing protein [Chromatiales bacterium]|nr:DUF2075 domain-containing protein [Chromatiales bacterium]
MAKRFTFPSLTNILQLNMSIVINNPGMARSWYGAAIRDFLASEADDILGKLSRHAGDGHFANQRDAWLAQIDLLHAQLGGLDGWIFFEFNIPRMGRRVDVILVLGAVIFALEFKVGESTYDRVAIEQVWDYALDLKNFHEASHNVVIAPILVATEAKRVAIKFEADADNVYRPVLTNAVNLRETLELGLSLAKGLALDAHAWARASYRPTPTIIEAARSLYAQHSVEAIARFDAGAQNLHTTSKRIEELVDEARSTEQKFICFVTGVPGAGKTLVGLNVATQRRDEKAPTHAVFLSGNAPLVAVLREALTRDEYFRLKALKQKATKKKIATPVKAFIQNVHHFRDAGLADDNAPPEHVVIFDEAQRAWNSQMTANFMRRKKGRAGFTQSEPEFLISYMDRHQDWAVIICLVGGGQEINIGEAGISAWLNAVIDHFPRWKMFISSRLHDSEYAAGNALELAQFKSQIYQDDSLHLAVSMRSFRAENVSAFVKALLDCETNAAREAFAELRVRFPIVLARDLDKAKAWIRSHARGSERFGLLASSKAMRLKPHAVDVRVDVDPVHYFLNDRSDVRSSYYLEDAATEFQVQGLELDWTCVTWDADFRFNGNGWNYHDFRGSRWTNIKNTDNRSYLRNAYRVLLTRARQGMVVFVPLGNENDPTRSPAFYDSTFNYLRELGIPEIV